MSDTDERLPFGTVVSFEDIFLMFIAPGSMNANGTMRPEPYTPESFIAFSLVGGKGSNAPGRLASWSGDWKPVDDE